MPLGIGGAEAQMLDEPLDAAPDKIQYVVEAARPAVWVRNFADAGLRRELKGQPQPVASLRRCG